MHTGKTEVPQHQVGVLCYSLTPATIDLLNRIARQLAPTELVAYPLVDRPIAPQVSIEFLWHPTTFRGRYLTIGGNLPDSQLASLQAALCYRLVSASRVVVLLGIQSVPAVITSMLARLRGSPTITVIQAMPVHLERRRSSVIRGLKRWVLQLADHHIAQTPGTRQTLEAMYGIPSHRITYAPFDGGGYAFARLCKLHKADSSLLRASLATAPEVIVYIFVGTLIYLKGIDLLLQAFAGLVHQQPRPRCPGMELWIVGPHGGTGSDVHAQLEEMSVRLGMTREVRFFGRKSPQELIGMYRAADVFVLPTRKDVWPKVLVEAAICGLPLITTDASDAAHTLVRDGVNGFVVPANNAEALQCAMSSLSESASVRLSMGRESRHIVEEFIQPDLEASVIAETIQGMLMQKQRRPGDR